MKELSGVKFKVVNVVVLDWEGYCGGCLRGGSIIGVDFHGERVGLL